MCVILLQKENAHVGDLAKREKVVNRPFAGYPYEASQAILPEFTQLSAERNFGLQPTGD